MKRTIPGLIYCITDTRQRDQREDNILAHFLNLIDSMFENRRVDPITVVDLNDVLTAISGYTTTHKLVSWEDAVRTSHPRSASPNSKQQRQEEEWTGRIRCSGTRRKHPGSNVCQEDGGSRERRDRETWVQRRVKTPKIHLLPEPRSHQGDPRPQGSSRQLNPSEIATLQLLCQAGQPRWTCFLNKVTIHKAPDVTGDLLQVLQETWTLHAPTSVRLPHR